MRESARQTARQSAREEFTSKRCRDYEKYENRSIKAVKSERSVGDTFGDDDGRGVYQ